jgi:hypothetical protein
LATALTHAQSDFTLEQLQDLDRRLDAILKEHEGHGSEYADGCRACIHRAAFNFQHGIKEVDARAFLSQFNGRIAQRDAAIVDVNEVMGDEFFVAPIVGEVPAFNNEGP